MFFLNLASVIYHSDFTFPQYESKSGYLGMISHAMSLALKIIAENIYIYLMVENLFGIAKHAFKINASLTVASVLVTN